MAYSYTFSADFRPDHSIGWSIFNIWLQRHTEESIHLEMYNDFHAQRTALQNDKIDLIYTNPLDAAMLVREKGFLPLVKPSVDSAQPMHSTQSNDVTQIKEDLKTVSINIPNALASGIGKLANRNIDKKNRLLNIANSPVSLANHLLNNTNSTGIFFKKAVDAHPNKHPNHLRGLWLKQSCISHNSLLIGPRLSSKREQLQYDLLKMNKSHHGKGILGRLGFNHWESIDEQSMEFIIDLMDTLTAFQP